MSLKFNLQPWPDTECILWERDETSGDLEKSIPTEVVLSLLREHPGAEFRRSEKMGVLYALETQWHLGNRLCKKENGAPFLWHDSRNISISHSKQYIAIGLSNGSRLGIDVEDLGRPIQHIAKRFLHPDEYSVFPTDPLKTLAWSMKEAVYKCIEQEGIDLREHIRFTHLTPMNSDHLMIHPPINASAYTANTDVNFKNRKYSLTLVCFLYAQMSYAISRLSDIN